MRKFAFIRPGRASVVVGGQFGSEAKGLAAAVLASDRPSQAKFPVICTTNAGAQAGHTTLLADERKFVCFHLPTIGVLNADARIYLNAGSIIDPEVLRQEIQDVSRVFGWRPLNLAARITIHPNAAVITPEAKMAEGVGSTGRIGSTMKGVGAAQAIKIMREPGSVAKDNQWLSENFAMEALDLMEEMEDGAAVTIEIPQGTGLSLNASGFFPYCTSRDCWVGQGLTDAGINPYYLADVAMVVRTMPIRVGNVTDEAGKVVGPSGPFYPDSRELDWSRDLPGIEPERTTVTKRVRRIATWSDKQYHRALMLNRPTRVFLTFTNYLTASELLDMVRSMRAAEARVGVNPGHVYSWGPRVDQHSIYVSDALPHCRTMMEAI